MFLCSEDCVKQNKELNCLLQLMTPDSDRRNSTAMYNPITVEELKEQYAHFDWDTYLGAVFADTNIQIGGGERLIMVQPDYFLNTQTVDASDTVMGKCHS